MNRRADRDGYFVQIGFDFGTAYSKCVCRDIMTEKAWVHLHTGAEEQEFPFLIPSVVLCADGRLSRIQNPGFNYWANGLHNLKHALARSALRDWTDPVLETYRQALGPSDDRSFTLSVLACAVYFLAGSLGEVRCRVRERLQGFGEHPDDYMAVNMAVPVGEAEIPLVNRAFHEVLACAWSLADQLKGLPAIRLSEMTDLVLSTRKARSSQMEEACFIYPEVSANVQGFVRSRASAPGIYLCSDVGGGTVDLSTFIFKQTDGDVARLTYLHGSVLPLGSGHIERRAAGGTTWEELEDWRRRKEGGEPDPVLQGARESIFREMAVGSQITLGRTKTKLKCWDQLNDIRLIFSGGGHCFDPYERGVRVPFSGSLFSEDIRPDVVGLPVPGDLELQESTRYWLTRLSVAYGLSFERDELAGFTYPVDVEPEKPEAVWKRCRHIPDAPTKDQV